MTVAGGTPTLTLNDGGTATYTGGSGTTALTFSYTVAAGQNTAGLAATAVNLNSATITDGAGNAASLSLTGLTQTGPQIDTTTPTISSLAESPSSGDLDAGKTVTLTLNMSEAVTVAGGTPTLTLNDGGTATYTSGSGTSALTFSYTVGAGQNTAALAATAVNLNSATITDGAGNAASLSLTGLTQTGPQIDTTTPTISSLTESPSSGDLDAGKTVTLTLNLSEAVTVSGRHADADAQRRRHRDLYERLRHHGADLQLHRRRRAEHRCPGGDRDQPQRRDHHGRRRQRRQPVAHRPDPDRAADRHHGADDLLAHRVTIERRPRCRQDRHADAQSQRSGDGRRRHADADAQRRRHRDLHERLRHQRADLQLHGRRRSEHRRPGGDRGQSQLGNHHRRRPAMPPVCRSPVSPRPARRSTPRRRRSRRWRRPRAITAPARC